MKTELHGVAACFATETAFLVALRRLRADGFVDLEANVPFAVEGMAELLPGKPTPIARIMLAAALAGGGGAYFLQCYAARDLPLNVGGRPLHSWPAFVPVTFELTVLTSAIVGVLALLWLARLPRLDHPIFAVPGIERATQDRFFVCIRASDPRFKLDDASERLRALGAEYVEEVRA